MEATTRSIQIDGEKGSVDLCESCYQENIAPVLNLVKQLGSNRRAEKPPGKRAAKKAPAKSAAKQTPTKSAAKKTAAKRATENAPAKRRRSETGPSAAAMRRWALEQGITVSSSGRVPRDLREHYLAAH